MAKVKKTKTFNFPELINYIKETNYQEKEYLSTNGTVSVSVRSLCRIRIDGARTIWPSDMFEVEIEEEIKEETTIPRLLEVRNAIPSKEEGWEDLKILKSYIYGNHTIAEVKNEYTVAFYMLNDDMTMTLIWKDGEIIGD